MRSIFDLLGEQPLFADLPEPDRGLIAGCGHNVHVAAGEPIVRHGAPADHFYLLRSGRAQLEIHQPGRGALVAETLQTGSIVGVSWLFPPYRYTFDAVAVEPCDLIAIDAACLRAKCDTDTRLGYLLMRRFAAVLVDRIEHLQIRLLDVYAHDLG
jgi:CRP-like cAMP-binding protein